jgi:hypothetical protein
MSHVISIAFGVAALLFAGPMFVAVCIGLFLRWLDAVMGLFNEDR